MSGYRFCRTDDVPLLVDAYNACRQAPLDEEPALTIEAFKRAARELGLWASSCMVAFEGETPIGVLLGAKQGDANLVYRIAIRAGHERRGHGRHLLDSLRSKVAILGPPRLLAEVPADWQGACRFFERCSFRLTARYADFVADEVPFSAVPGGVVEELTFDDLQSSGVLEGALRRSWESSLPTLAKRKSELRALAIVSDVNVEAHVLYEGGIVHALGGRIELLHWLFGDLYQRTGGPLRISRIDETEMELSLLAALGFRKEREIVGYAAEMGKS